MYHRSAPVSEMDDHADTSSPMPSFSASRCDLREPRSSFKFLFNMIFVARQLNERVDKLSGVCIPTYVLVVQFSLVMMTFKSESLEKETKLSKLTTCWRNEKDKFLLIVVMCRIHSPIRIGYGSQISVDCGHGSNSLRY
jgi:hypothetical protein